MKIVRALIVGLAAGAVPLATIFYGFLAREENLPPFEAMEELPSVA